MEKNNHPILLAELLETCYSITLKKRTWIAIEKKPNVNDRQGISSRLLN